MDVHERDSLLGQFKPNTLQEISNRGFDCAWWLIVNELLEILPEGCRLDVRVEFMTVKVAKIGSIFWSVVSSHSI